MKQKLFYNLFILSFITGISFLTSNCKKDNIDNSAPEITSAAADSATVGEAYSYQITATNFSTSFNATGLPSGLSVDTGTGLIDGTPLDSGIFIVSLYASNEYGRGTGSLELFVASAAPVITSSASVTDSIGNIFTYQITATNNPTSYNAVGLPEKLTLDRNTGLIHGELAESGDFTVTLSATNSFGTGIMELALTIVNLPPQITSAAVASASAGIDFSYQIFATKNPTNYDAAGLPAGLTIDTETGLINGAATVTGDFNVKLSATNPAGTGNLDFLLTVVPAPTSEIPAPATSVGYNRLTFNDEFDSIETIDVEGTKEPEYNWYVDRPIWGGNTITQPDAYSVENGILTVTSTGYSANWAIQSYSIRGRTGHAFRYGYFEARIRFDPTLGKNVRGFPAWWAFSVYHSRVNNTDRWAELDFFEAYTGGYNDYSGAFVGTVHDWQNSSQVHYQNKNNWQQLPSSTDFNDWHTYSCLWVPGRITWYFDGVELIRQYYSAIAPPNPLANGTISPTPEGIFSILDTDPEGILLILGSDEDWPMEVDWVRVWQQQ